LSRPASARTRRGRLGYHEVFHALVIVAAALQYAAIAFFVLPGARQ
jgi:predicted membrane channel-forming protein YqfA (hemolysin III family)